MSILFIATTIGTLGRLGVGDRFLGLRHHAVVGRHHQDHDVGRLGAARAHRGERGVARRVEEGDHAARRLDVVGADVLRDAARLAGRHARGADVVEQRGLAVVDVAHDGDHRRARLQLVRVCGVGLFLEERLGIVELGGERLVAHLLDHDHRRLLVELLVDGDHLAQLHQLLDDLGRLDRHLVRQVGDADRLGHVHFLHLRLGRRDEVLGAPSLRSPRRPRARRAPAGAAAPGASRGGP